MKLGYRLDGSIIQIDEDKKESQIANDALFLTFSCDYLKSLI